MAVVTVADHQPTLEFGCQLITHLLLSRGTSPTSSRRHHCRNLLCKSSDGLVPPDDHIKLICTAAFWINPLVAPRSFFVCARKLAQKHTSIPRASSRRHRSRTLAQHLDSRSLAQYYLGQSKPSSILSWTVGRWLNIFILVFVTRVHTTNMPCLLTSSLWRPRALARYLKRRMMGWVRTTSRAKPPTPRGGQRRRDPRLGVGVDVKVILA